MFEKLPIKDVDLLWQSKYLRERIIRVEGRYVMIQEGSMLSLGETLEEVKLKLQRIKRHDIVKDLS
ncbi:hypothetical protein Ga0466249_000611 [Sporomusaceae bacterium BoRhaA]|uniref:hypothetical protein n=1 Tax=Pelorhabdus rhamnosifermentans TaxID=2772457 RepID=UPI001C061EB7|nr:hypothetical protein [Pelorhabdus rhamnosifermentans]MBU2699532.1 hypothetical protein [Pelorhabdus rhamnosifermentans]